MKTDEKIEEIIDKYIDHLGVGKIPDTEWSEDKKQMIEELNTEVQKAREEALGEFMKMVKIDPDSCFYRFSVPEQMAISTYINEIFEKVGNYLQTLKDKDENR